MAQGDVVFFDAAMEDTFEKKHDFSSDTFKCAIVDNTIVPAATTAAPTWGAAGTTNLSTNEQTGGNFTAGGNTLATPTSSLSAGVLQLDFGDPAVWTKNASNPQTCYWGIVYNDTATDKNCVAYVDLGGVFDARTGDLTITWGAPFTTVDQA